MGEGVGEGEWERVGDGRGERDWERVGDERGERVGRESRGWGMVG